MTRSARRRTTGDSARVPRPLPETIANDPHARSARTTIARNRPRHARAILPIESKLRHRHQFILNSQQQRTPANTTQSSPKRIRADRRLSNGPMQLACEWRRPSTSQVREPRTTRPGSSERAPNWPNRRTLPNEPKRHTRPNTPRQNRHSQRNCHTTNQPLPAIGYKSNTTSTLRKNRVRDERLAAYTPTSYSRRNHEIRSLYRAYLF